MEILADKITEWSETVEEASRELDAALLRARPDDQLKIAIDEAGLELDLAREELAGMLQANELLERVSTQLNHAGRAMLAQAVELLCDVDWPKRTDALAGEAQRLQRLRD